MSAIRQFETQPVTKARLIGYKKKTKPNKPAIIATALILFGSIFLAAHDIQSQPETLLDKKHKEVMQKVYGDDKPSSKALTEAYKERTSELKRANDLAEKRFKYQCEIMPTDVCNEVSR